MSATAKTNSFVEKTAAAIARKALQDAIETITGNTTEDKAIKTAPHDSASIETAEKKCAYIFFNCDVEKKPASMNILYNNEAFSDSVTGRQALLEKIKTELAAGNIGISNLEAVEEAVLKGDPTDANNLISYGNIEYLLSL